MWEKIKIFCLNSLTVAWSYFLAAVGFLLDMIVILADILDEPELKGAITSIFGDSPKVVATMTMVIGIITFLARMRSLRKSS